MKNNKIKKISKTLISLGIISILMALSLAIYNLYSENQANSQAQEVLAQMQLTLDETYTDSTQIPAYEINENINMPTILIDGVEYIGVLEVPALSLTLPISSDWSYTQLKSSPCRYTGSAYTNDLVIAAHNYTSHFGNLKNLDLGAIVIFTDVDSNEFIYEVVGMEIIEPTQIEEMTQADDWDLTLFTCSYGGSVRLAIRCSLTAK